MARVNQGQTQSDQVDHQETSNRTHDGDDLTPDTVDVTSEFGNPTYATLSDVPNDLPEGTQVYVKDENQIYVEDGT